MQQKMSANIFTHKTQKASAEESTPTLAIE